MKQASVSLAGQVETEGGQVIQFSAIKPVRWSIIDGRVKGYRAGFVKTFLEYEGRPLLDEDGAKLVDGAGRPRKVTVAAFSDHYGISRRTFQDWVFAARGYSSHHNLQVRQVDRGGIRHDLNEEWAGWLNSANTLLMKGARLEERTEAAGVEVGGYGAFGRLIYQRITERKLDAELRQLFDESAGGAP